jgi:hypothetical protein
MSYDEKQMQDSSTRAEETALIDGRPTARDTLADVVTLIEDAKRAMIKTNDITSARSGAFSALNDAQRLARMLDLRIKRLFR